MLFLICGFLNLEEMFKNILTLFQAERSNLLFRFMRIINYFTLYFIFAFEEYFQSSNFCYLFRLKGVGEIPFFLLCGVAALRILLKTLILTVFSERSVAFIENCKTSFHYIFYE